MLAITRFSAEQATELNDAIKPRLSLFYQQTAPLLSGRGRKVVSRAMARGTVGGDIGMQLLFEPAMLVSFVAAQDVMYVMAVTAAQVPFVGNYNQWLPDSATIATAYRALLLDGDPRAADVELWLSLPENGGMLGPPVVHEAMRNRLNGLLVEQIRSDDYMPPP